MCRRSPHVQLDRLVTTAATLLHSLAVFSLDLSCQVQCLATGWSSGTAALNQSWCAYEKTRFASTARHFRTHCSNRHTGAELRVSGYARHGLSRDSVPTAARVKSADAPMRECRKANGTSGNAFQPPRDIIKLQDRLYYVLQPPLETSGQLGAN